MSASCYFYMKLMLKRGYVIFFFLTLDAAEHIMHVRTMALFPLPSFLLYCLVFHYYSSCINDERKPTDVHSPGGGRCFASLLFFFLLLYFPSLQNPVVELCYTRSLSLHCASCMHTCIHQWPVTNTQEPLSANKKKTQLSDLESTLGAAKKKRHLVASCLS